MDARALPVRSDRADEASVARGRRDEGLSPDGFVDRYTVARLALPAALRTLSILLPDEFPFHPSCKMEITHPAYWELYATIDHVVPVTRGGADDLSNWVTTSQARNSAKDVVSVRLAECLTNGRYLNFGQPDPVWSHRGKLDA